MTEALPHPSPGPGGVKPLLLRLLAGLLAVLAGACAMLFVPLTLLVAATSSPSELAPGVAPWMIYAWCLFAFLASIGTVMASVAALETPRLRRVLIPLGVMVAVFVTFPPFMPVPA